MLGIRDFAGRFGKPPPPAPPTSTPPVAQHHRPAPTNWKTKLPAVVARLFPDKDWQTVIEEIEQKISKAQAERSRLEQEYATAALAAEAGAEGAPARLMSITRAIDDVEQWLRKHRAALVAAVAAQAQEHDEDAARLLQQERAEIKDLVEQVQPAAAELDALLAQLKESSEKLADLTTAIHRKTGSAKVGDAISLPLRNFPDVAAFLVVHLGAKTHDFMTAETASVARLVPTPAQILDLWEAHRAHTQGNR